MPYLPGKACVRSEFHSRNVSDNPAISTVKLFTTVAEVEIQSTVRPKGKAVNAVIVLRPLDAGEEDFTAVGFQVAVVIVEREHTVARRYDHAVAEHTDAVGRVNLFTLIEDGFAIRDGVSVSVFEHQNSIPSGRSGF